TEVLLTGARFAEGVRARFGGVEATALQRIGPTLVSVITPPHEAGPGEGSVEDPDGSRAPPLRAFTYLASAPPRDPLPGGERCPGPAEAARRPAAALPRRPTSGEALRGRAFCLSTEYCQAARSSVRIEQRARAATRRQASVYCHQNSNRYAGSRSI